MKQCTKCKKFKDISEYHKDKTHNDGHDTVCIECHGMGTLKEKRCCWFKCQKWFTTRSERKKFCCNTCLHKHHSHIYQRSVNGLISARKTKAKHREQYTKLWKDWYAKNKERIKEYKKDYYARNKKVIAIKSSARYYRKKERCIIGT